MRIIKSMEETYKLPALELVETVFTASEGAESGRLVRSLDGMHGQVCYSDYTCLT